MTTGNDNIKMSYKRGTYANRVYGYHDQVIDIDSYRGGQAYELTCMFVTIVMNM